ncbi:MAG: NCS2 family permease [Halobacteriaceae archaeon]
MSTGDTLGGYFGLDEHDTTLRRELVAGVTTFLTMSYIIAVNPLVLSGAITDAKLGTPEGRAIQLLTVATILAAVVAMLVMAFYANRPFGLASGMGLNAFFVVVVTQMGVAWQTALAAVFVEGVVFIALTAVGAREYIIGLFPEPVKRAVGPGIGLFLALIGLNFMHVIAADAGDITSLNPYLAQDPVAVLSLFGIFLTFVLYARRVRGAIVLSILATSVAAYAASAAGVTQFGGELPDGINLAFVTFAPGFQSVTYSPAAYNIAPLFGAFVDGLANADPLSFLVVVFTFFFVDFFDTAGTVTGLGQAAGFLDEDGNLVDMDKPLMADAVGTTVGAVLGTSTVTTFIESSTGIEEGGRTGMVPLVVAVLFLVSLVFVPLLSAIPSFAPYVAFLAVAVFMFQNIFEIAWSQVHHAVPATLTIAMMPLTNSISNGIAFGIVAYPIVAVAAGEREDTRPGHWVLAAAFVLYFVVRYGGFVR